MKAWLFAAALLAAASTAFGAGLTTLVRDAELRADKLPDAAPLASLTRGTPVLLLARFGGWAQVETTTAPLVRGWVRGGFLDGAVQLATAATLPAGRSTAGASAVTLGIRGTPSTARWHAVLVTASPPDHGLRGLQADWVAMQQVLAATAVQWVAVRHLDAAAASPSVVLAVIADIVRDARPGDGLLLHVAGAGTRTAAGTGCVEALQLAWGRTLAGQDLGTALRAAVERGVHFVGAYDADFEPGGARFAPGASCTQPAVAFEDAVAAAARPAQRAFTQWRLAGGSADDADDGGLLTGALRDCVAGTGAQAALADASTGAIGRCMSARIAHAWPGAPAAPMVRTQGSTAWSPWRDPADQWGR